MKQQTRRRLAWLVLFLIIVWGGIYVKTQLLPMLLHPLTLRQDSSTPLTIYTVGLLALGLTFMALMYPRKKTTTAHGSAHFATDEELRTYGTLVTTPRK